MIAHLRGKIAFKSSTEIVMDCGGVGYAVSTSVTTSEALPPAGEEATILTLMSVREDAIQLFGFSSEAERDVFKLLTSISGIGAKIALGILSSISLADLREVILHDNIVYLQKLPGIGKKTAERIVIELRDKMGKVAYDTGDNVQAATQLDVRQEALAALIALGYSRPVAEKAIKQALAAEPNTVFKSDTLIRKALRNVQ